MPDHPARGESRFRVAEKAANAIHYLIDNGCTPYVYYRNGTRQIENKTDEGEKADVVNNNTDNPALVPDPSVRDEALGQVMGDVWYSHKADGEWCRA